MKKIIAVTVIALSSISFANAAPNNIGSCGWGSMLFKGKSGTMNQVFAVTTNSTFGNQTFGITSGTAGCKENGVVTSTAALSTFMAANIDKVSHDMAVGKGESLTTMANLMGIAEQDKASFYKTTRDNFDAIFVSEKTTVKQVINNLDKVMAKDAKLAQYAA